MFTKAVPTPSVSLSMILVKMNPQVTGIMAMALHMTYRDRVTSNHDVNYNTITIHIAHTCLALQKIFFFFGGGDCVQSIIMLYHPCQTPRENPRGWRETADYRDLTRECVNFREQHPAGGFEAEARGITRMC